MLQILCRCHPGGYLADWLEEGNGRGDSGQLQSFEPLAAEASLLEQSVPAPQLNHCATNLFPVNRMCTCSASGGVFKS